jgi:hypothetical protein
MPAHPTPQPVLAVPPQGMRGTRLAPSTNGILRVILEGDVERLSTYPDPDPDVKDIRGLIYAFEWGTSQWVQLTTTDFSDGSYGFYAPRETYRPYDSTFDGAFRSMRRTFEFSGVDLTDFVKTETSGEYVINLKLVQTGDEPFITKYDLVQCLYINGSSVGASPACPALPPPEEPAGDPESMLGWGPGAPQGGDMNYDGQHSTEDTVTFSQAYIIGHPSADVNNDGVIDNADVLHYFAAIEEE